MHLQEIIVRQVKEIVQESYKTDLDTVEVQATNTAYEGDLTIVIFPMLRYIKGNPEHIGNAIGVRLVETLDEVVRYNTVKGFLNLVIADSYYLRFFNSMKHNVHYGYSTPGTVTGSIIVEYSSPNTNKPLHLGHIRNILLGYSVAEILKASGKKVYKTQIINDRGIHICKSMVAYRKYGNGEEPSETLKGDKLVGNYYVKFDNVYKAEVQEMIAGGMTKEDAGKKAPVLQEAQHMLRNWESGDTETIVLWKKMNQWVYDGFDSTYTDLGVDFDKLYYESDTYLLGKAVVNEGLARGVFYKKSDGSVWVDLTDEGLDEKIVLRADGTAVYMTQDIGTAIQRVKDHPDITGMVYTVGNEQDYHFKVLFFILKKLGFQWAENLYHLSYGMVDLPTGKMKSREGTVVDADDLIAEMTKTAGKIAEDLGKLDGYSEEEKQNLYRVIGLGALKYFILKVDPRKRILFNPEASVDFTGNTGPFIQYTYARIQSILRKTTFEYDVPVPEITLHEKEKQLLKHLELFPEVIREAANQYSPALLANYTYELVKDFNSFYQRISILGAETEDEKIFRVQLSRKVGEVIRSGCKLLGINVPERM